MAERPLIGLTTGATAVPIPEGHLDSYYVGRAYVSMLHRAGADVVLLPAVSGDEEAGAERALERIDGLMVPGGIDIEPSFYGGDWDPVQKPDPPRDVFEAALIRGALERGMPVLGVCRGMQVMNHHLGGTLARVHGHVAKRHALRVAAGAPLLAGHAEVNSYHGWGIEAAGVAADLVALAWSEDGSVEACRHRRLPWIGIMWHPEREAPASEADARLIHDAFFNPEGGPA